MITSFDEFITEKKNSVRTFRFLDRKQNDLTDLNNEYSNINPDTVNILNFANDIFKNYTNCYSVIVHEFNYANDETIEKFEVVRSNPSKIIQY